MENKDLEAFEEKLKKWEEKLCSSKYELEVESSSEIIDQANRETMLDLEAAKSEHNEKILKEINHALKKIKQGTYGICEESGDEIEVRRLKANPIARFSIESQRDMEKESKR